MNQSESDFSESVATPETSSLDVGHQPKPKGWLKQSLNPFRIATLRGLGVLLPPLLTIVFFYWAWTTIERAILRPIESVAKELIVLSIADIRSDSEVQASIAKDQSQLRTKDGSPPLFVDKLRHPYRQVGGEWIPEDVHAFVKNNSTVKMPETAHQVYLEFASLRFLKRHLVIPAFLAAFVAFLYLTGKLMAAGVGRILWKTMEGIIHRLPIISNVYSSVKQVTDFAFSENEVQFNRVVALEYPRRGIWSMGFVTGESFLAIKDAAGEPMLSVLMPTSPMPATGFTISVPKSETIDLDITIDQAIQFCVSCGVVVPEHQQPRIAIEGDVRKRFRQQVATSVNGNGAVQDAASKHEGGQAVSESSEENG